MSYFVRIFFTLVILLGAAIPSAQAFWVGEPTGPGCFPGQPCGDTTPPPAPSNVAVPATNASGAFSVTWTAPNALISHYKLYWRQSGQNDVFLTELPYNATSHALSSQPSGLYSYALAACRNSGDSNELCSATASSGQIEIRIPPSTPAAPSNVNSTSTSFTVSWSKPAGTVTHYIVQERVYGGTWSTIASNHSSTSISRSGKSDNTRYQYRVQACNTQSWACSSVSAANLVHVELKPSTPAKPADINATATSYTVSWSKPSGTVNFYQVQERVAGGSWTTINSGNSTTAIGVSNKANNSTYQYRVRACNSYSWACSSYSTYNTVKIRLKPSTPAAPTSNTTSTGSVDLSWVKPSGTVTYYDVEKRFNNGGSWTSAKAGDTNTSETISGLTDGTWDFHVRACNEYSWACSSYSSASSDVVTRLVPSVPAAPTLPSSSTGNYSVAWSKPSGAVTHYDLIEYETGVSGNTTLANDTSALSYAISNQDDGSYTYRVRACNEFNWSCSSYSSHSASISVLQVPGVPSSISVPSQDTDANATISWGSASGNVAQYELERRFNGGSWSSVYQGTSTSFAATDHITGNYDYRVRACNASGCSPYQNWSRIQVRLMPNVAATPSVPSTSTGGATVSWTSATHATYYVVEKRLNSGSWQTVSSNASGNSISASGLTDGSWDFRIRACNQESWACSSYGAVSAATTVRVLPGNPGVVSGNPATSTSGEFNISWNAASGAVTRYDVFYREDNTGSYNLLAANVPNLNYAVDLGDGVYDFRIRACNEFTWSCRWNVIGTNTEIRQVPSAPLLSAPATSDTDSLVVSWNTPDFATYFALEYRFGNGLWTSIDGHIEANSTPVATTSSGTYQFRAKSCNLTPWSCSSYSSVVETQVSVAPAHAQKADTVQDAIPELNSVPNSDVVGALEGTAAISGGAGTYSIPIALPPGRAGMQPNVALSYSSRAGSGEIGVGWSMSAGGSIHRCSKTFAQDGYAASYDYSVDDRLCLNGQRLVAESSISVATIQDREIAYSSAYGQANTTYRTELDSFARVTQLGGNLNQANTYFVVEYKNGSVEYYGSSSDSRHSQVGRSENFAWALKKREDRTSKKNNIIYFYEDLGYGEYVLKNIKYTGDEQNEGTREVNFIYDTRSKPVVGYEFGLQWKKTARLANIQTFVDEPTFGPRQLVREYQLQYEPSGYSQRDLLSSVSECGLSNGILTCLPPSTFDYGSSNQQAYQLDDSKMVSISDIHEPQMKSASPRFSDYSGDGHFDLKVGSRIFFELNNSMTEELDAAPGNIQDIVYSGSRRSNDFDFNRDGRTDSFTVRSLGSFDYTPIIFLSNPPSEGVGFSNTAIETNIVARCENAYTHNFGNPLTSNPYQINCGVIPVDLNGDSITDLAVVDHPSSYDDIRVRIYRGCDNCSSPFELEQTYYYPETRNYSFSPVDIDGDGRTDLVAVFTKLNPHVAVIRNTSTAQGMSFEQQQRNIDVDTWQNGSYSHWGDFNGDGLRDLIIADYQYRHQLVLNTGSGFTAPIQIPLPVGIQYEEFPNQPVGDNQGNATGQFIQVMDYNSDGIDDLLYPAQVTYFYNPCDWAPDTTTCNDIIASGQASPSMKFRWQNVYKWEAFVFRPTASGSFSYSTIENTGIEGTLGRTSIQDIDADGNLDVITLTGYDNESSELPAGATTLTGMQLTKELRTFINQYDSVPDILKSTQNGFGVSSSFAYKTLFEMSQSGEYRVTEVDKQPPYFNFTSTAVFAHKIEQSDGIGGSLSTRYKYVDATYNNEGRGFQGFKSIIVDSPSGIRSVSDFHQHFPLAGNIKEVRTCLISDADSYCASQPLSLTTIDHYQEFTTANNFTHWVIPQTTTETTYDLNNRALELMTKTTSIDVSSVVPEFGQVKDTTEVVDTKFGVLTTQTVVDFATADESNWWINKVLTTTVTTEKLSNTSANSAYDASLDFQSVVETAFTYTNERKIDVVTSTPLSGGGTQSIVDTDYTTFGMPKKVTTIAENGEERFVISRYDLDGYFVEEVENQLGHKTVSLSDPTHGQVISATDPNGITVVTAYDAFGRVEEVSVAGSPTSFKRYFWCDSGNGYGTCADNAVYQMATYQDGAPTIVSHKDGFNRDILAETKGYDGSSIYVYATFNSLGQKLFESVPSQDINTYLGTTYNQYDALGRLTHRTTDTAGGQIDVVYDYQGHTTSIIVNGRPEMTRTHDGAGRLIATMQQTDGIQSITRYAYDSLGNPIVMRDANGNRITAQHNALGQKQWVNDPNMGLKTFTYTDFGEVASETDANQVTTDYVYDSLGRLLERWIDDQKQASFQFDTAQRGSSGDVCDGLPVSATQHENGHVKSFTYDELCRATQVHELIDGETFTVTHHFDSYYGRVKGLTYPNGLTIEYGYNDNGYLETLKNAASGYVYQQIMAMDDWGQWSHAKLADNNLLIERNYYEASGQMLESHFRNGAGSLTFQSVDYTYDEFGNLIRTDVANEHSSPQVLSVEEFEYDDLHRLKRNTRTVDGVSLPEVLYSYDKVGNLLRKTDFSTTTIGSIHYGDTLRTNGNAGPNAVKSVSLTNGGGTRKYEYDNNGNLIVDKLDNVELRSIQYNAFNKPILISVEGGRKLNPFDESPTMASSAQFFYAADQMRFKQLRTTVNTSETTYYIGKLYEEVRSDNRVEKKLYIGDIAQQTEVTENGSTQYEIGYFHKDRLGSSIAISNETGATFEGRSFDPFGKPRKDDLSNNPNNILGDTIYKRGFTDHEQLDDSQLIHMNGRAYDYNLGRFLSVDPLIQEQGNSQSMNPYSYIMNNPLGGTDPSGYKWETVWDRETGTLEELEQVLTDSGFEVSNGYVNLNHPRAIKGEEAEKLLSKLEDDGYIKKSRGGSSSKSTSGGTLYRVKVDVDGTIVSRERIQASDIQNGDTVFTNGIQNELSDAEKNGRDHIYQVDGEYSSFVLFYNPTAGLGMPGIFSDLFESKDDMDAYQSGSGYSDLAMQLGGIMDTSAGKNVRFIGHSQGGAITAAAVRYAHDKYGTNMSGFRIALHGAPVNNGLATRLFTQAGVGSYKFRAQAGDPVHYIGGGNGTFWQQLKSLRNTFALFGDATVSPHTLPCKKSRTAVCN